jgi:hypothetical protein
MQPEMKELTVDEKINGLNHIRKLQMWGAYQREVERINEEKPIRDANENLYRRLGVFTKINDWLTITEFFETSGEKRKLYAAIIDGKLVPNLFIRPEEAILCGLGVKYDGINTQFHHFAARMLPGFVDETI